MPNDILKRETCGKGGGTCKRLPAEWEHPGHRDFDRKVARGEITLGIKVYIKYRDGTEVWKTL